MILRKRQCNTKNHATEQVGGHLTWLGSDLSQLGREVGARDFLDDADVEVIRSKLTVAKTTLDQIEVEVAATDSKVRQVAPVQDGTSIPGGVFSGPVGVRPETVEAVA